jgi:hypothetical protein
VDTFLVVEGIHDGKIDHLAQINEVIHGTVVYLRGVRRHKILNKKQLAGRG